MTCIVGIVNGQKVIIGGDRQGSAGYAKTNRIDKKVFKRGEFVFGFTSSYRMGQLIQYKMSIPKFSEGQDLMEYMVCDFVENLRSTLKGGGFTAIENNEEIGGHFLVGVRGRLFHIQGDFQVSESDDKFDSVGSGEDNALGSMKTAIDYGETDPYKILKSGLDSAHYFNAGVGGEFDYVDTELLQ